uniref:C-C motif chemokine n=1 Tax=Amphilophus citrinellus TaxID=61819 RepID=A0A3Q0SIS6_AMPCI
MRTIHILLLCILGAALLSTVDCNNANGPDKCCFEFYPRSINKKLIRSYTVSDRRCAKAAVILVTKRSHQICADPSLSWVKSIMKTLDKNSF